MPGHQSLSFNSQVQFAKSMVIMETGGSQEKLPSLPKQETGMMVCSAMHALTVSMATGYHNHCTIFNKIYTQETNQISVNWS